MPLNVNLGLAREDVDAAAAALEGIKNGLPRAYSRALNKTAENTRTAMVAMCRDEYTYKADAVRSRIIINRATWSALMASVRSSGKEVNITDFLGTRQIGSGVSVDIKKSTGRKIIPRAFIRKAKVSEKPLALRRPGNPRGQHQILYSSSYGPPGSGGKVGSQARLDWFAGPHPELIYNTTENWHKLQDDANERLQVNFSEEVDGVLRQYG
jgi:hypothetical protein